MKIESGAGLTLNGAMLRNVPEEKAAEAVQAPLVPSLAGHQVRDNLMEGSFMDMNSGSSRYIEATMIGLKVNSEFKNKMGSILESYKLQAEATDSYAEKNLIGQKAANAVGDMVEGEVSESEAERMEKEREEFEEKIEEKQEAKASGEEGTAEEAGASAEAADQSGTAVAAAQESSEPSETAGESAEVAVEGDVVAATLDLTV